MRISLGSAPAAYAKAFFDGWRAVLEKADREAYKRDEDLELFRNRLILTDRVTGERYQLVVDSGAFSAEALL